MMHCSRCNAENPASVKRCLLCGSPLTLAETATPRKPVAGPPRDRTAAAGQALLAVPDAEARHRTGAARAGLALLDEAEAAVEHIHERYREAEIHRLHGQLLLAIRSRCSEWPIRLSSASIALGSRISSH